MSFIHIWYHVWLLVKGDNLTFVLKKQQQQPQQQQIFGLDYV